MMQQTAPDPAPGGSPFSLKGLATGTILSILIGVVAPIGVVFQYFLIGFNSSSPSS